MLKNSILKTFFYLLSAAVLSLQISCSSESNEDKNKKEVSEQDKSDKKGDTVAVETIVCDTVEDHTFENLKKEAEKLPDGALSKEYNDRITELSASWDSLMQSEKQKRENLERLLDEVSYNPAHDEVALKRHRNMLCLLRSELYTPESLADLDNIDEYDAMQDSIIQETFSFVEETKNMDDFPLAKELMDEINEANNESLLMLRARYGDKLEHYNAFVIEHSEELDKEGVNVKPLPTWYGDPT